MSDDFEANLRAMRLTAPSPDLDHRMAALFASAPRIGRGWWLAALATAGVAAAVLILLSPSTPPPGVRAVVYRVEASGPLREWLLTPPPESQSPPTMIVTVGR